MKKFFIIFGSIIFISAVFLAVVLLHPNGNKVSTTLHIPKNATYEQLLDSLNAHRFIKNDFTFTVASKLMLYKRVKPGKYTISPSENNFSIVRKLRKGQHYPVKFVFNNIRTKEQFVKKIGGLFLFSGAELNTLLNDSVFLKQYRLTPANCIAVFVPNTYELYYDIDAKDFFDRMYREYKKIWNKQRLALADSIGLTPVEVAILASIVEEENYKETEKAMISGLYINRLHKNMKLEADPTVKFALGDFSLKRIYIKDINEAQSPYNTYLHYGLPPGPIRIPAISTVDSVLHYTRHDYIFMCAKEDFSGMHNFAKTYREHEKNRTKYRKALDKLQK